MDNLDQVEEKTHLKHLKTYQFLTRANFHLFSARCSYFWLPLALDPTPINFTQSANSAQSKEDEIFKK